MQFEKVVFCVNGCFLLFFFFLLITTVVGYITFYKKVMYKTKKVIRNQFT